MQSLVFFAAVLVGAAIADQMVLSSDDLKDQNRDISSKEYLKKIFQQDSEVFSAETSGRGDILDLLGELKLKEAASIAAEVDLREILEANKLDVVTLCLPTDEAVRKWMKELPEALRPDTEALKQLVKAWIVPGFVYNQEPNNLLVKTLNGAKLRVNVYRNGPEEIDTINGARVIKSKMNFLGARTVVVYVVDKVIYPIPVGDVIETLDDSFSVFIDLVKKAGMTEALKTPLPITVLIPTDIAFKALSDEDLDELKKNPAKLRQVLEYHVITDVRYSASLSSGQKIMTARGSTVSVDIEDGKVILNKEEKQPATVVKADVPTTNGVIHVIDHVLIPPEKQYFLV